jgi:hypothetical protein
MRFRPPSWTFAVAVPVSLWVSAVATDSLAADSVAAEGVAAEQASAPEPAAAPVMLASRGDVVDVERLRALLAAELKREVVLEHEPRAHGAEAVVTVSYRREAAELAVTWDASGRTLTRVIPAPSDGAALEGDAALLAGNLAREQVEDLLPAKPVAVAPPAPVAPAPGASEPERRPVTVGIFYPLASHHGHAEVTSSFDLNLLYGRVGAIDGAQLGGVNVVSREQGAASVRGMQIGLVANLVDGQSQGLQLAGLLNQVASGARGAQLTLGGNLTLGELHGAQAALLFNRSGELHGLQLSPVNIAGDVDGVQIGLVNIAHRVRGASVGLVNIADDIDGLPLAPFSVTRSGGVHPSAWSGTSGLGNVGVKLATRHTYTLFFGSYHRDYGLEFLGGGFALGGSLELGAGFRSDLDVCGTYLIAPAESTDTELQRSYHEQLVQPRLRLMIGYRLAQHFGAFLGVAGMGQLRSELGWDRVSASVGPEIFGGIEL